MRGTYRDKSSCSSKMTLKISEQFENYIDMHDGDNIGINDNCPLISNQNQAIY